MPEYMKAAQRSRYGSAADVLHIENTAIPEPGPDEILIAVHATTVNRTDCGFLRGEPRFARAIMGIRAPNVPVLGCEYAGVVVQTGPAVAAFREGDRVFGYNDSKFGAHAQYLTVAQDSMVTTIPDGLTFREAAPSTEGAHYALQNLRRAGVSAGQRVLIYGATGAIGSAAVQIAKFFGAEVSAACDPQHFPLVEPLGADHLLDRFTFDLSNPPERFDVIFDAVGKLSFSQARPALTTTGTYCSTELGPFPSNPVLALATPLGRRRRVIFPIPQQRQSDALFLRGMLAAGKMHTLIDRGYPLEQITEAFAYVETGSKLGSVIIDVPH